MTTHTITLARHTAQVVGPMGVLVLGTWDSYGTEQLLLRPGPEWDGLAIDATFHNVPNDEGVTVLADTDGLVTVPPEACIRPSRCATITIRGVQDGVQRISCNLPYMVLDHAQVPGANSTATPSEHAQALAQMQDLRDGAVDAKRHAEAARDAAANSATAAAASKKAAASSAVAAAGSAAQAEAQKTAAETAASDAQGYMQTASGAATAANASAENAAASADKANAGKTAAAASASNAVASASNAAASASSAATAASDAQGYMQTASDAATAANASAKSAEGSKAAAASSATAAAGSATAAAGNAKTASDAAAGAAAAKAAAVAAQKDAAASKAAAANSSAAAKISEDAAAKSAADANSTANSINNSMMQIAALQKRQNVLVGSETGNPIDVDDAFAAPLCGLTVYGRSTQDGTPTPDAPVPIVSAGDSGSVAVKVTGKNLLYIPDGSGTTRGVTVTAKDGLISISGTATETGYVSLGITPFIISGVVVNLTSSIKSPNASLVAKNYSAVIHQGMPGKMSNAATRLTFTVVQGQTYNLTGVKVQLELGTTATPYEPYREQILTLPTPNGLPGIPVTSGGNYTDQNGQQWVCDEIDLERGVKVQRITTIVFSDKKKFGLRTTNISTKFRFSAAADELKTTNLKTADSSAFCSALALGTKDSTWTMPNTFTIGSDVESDVNLYVRFENINSLDELQQYLQRTPMSLTAILATPIETPLTPAEIAAYKALTAYAPDTLVQASDGAGIKLDYQRDVNLVVKNLEDAIASMTTT